MTLSSVALYRRMIREGAWWDFVDEIAVQIIGIDPQTLDWVGALVRSLIAFTMFWALFNVVEPLSFLISGLLARLGVSESAKETLRGFFIRLLKFIVFALGVAAVLQEWGFNVAAVLGGLGLAVLVLASVFTLASMLKIWRYAFQRQPLDGSTAITMAVPVET